MAERRMFAKSIIDSDAFLDMPISTQCLYFHLGINADDDGFVGNPKRILRTAGAADDDLKLLVAKNFLIPFKTGVCAITHWNIHNYIQKDRYKSTMHVVESQTLSLENGVYTICTQNVYNLDTQVRLGKDNLDKDSCCYIEPTGRNKSSADIEQKQQKIIKVFKKPTIEEIKNYCKERNNSIDANNFFDYYEAKGWMIGKNKMKDWRAALRTWERNDSVKNQNIMEGMVFD